MVYFQDHKDTLKPGEKNQGQDVGKAHAFKHHLIGYDANTYALFFSDALDALVRKDLHEQDGSGLFYRPCLQRFVRQLWNCRRIPCRRPRGVILGYS
jgi:hypothetical protein